MELHHSLHVPSSVLFLDGIHVLGTVIASGKMKDINDKDTSIGSYLVCIVLFCIVLLGI